MAKIRKNKKKLTVLKLFRDNDTTGSLRPIVYRYFMRNRKDLGYANLMRYILKLEEQGYLLRSSKSASSLELTRKAKFELIKCKIKY